MNRRVIVVGGGAAGLMAAGQAAGLGADVLLFEKKNRPGRKLRYKKPKGGAKKADKPRTPGA